MVKTTQASKNKRLAAPMTIFKGATSKKPVALITFSELIEKINQASPEAAESLQRMKQGDPDGYTQEKKKLSAFSSGKFNYGSLDGLQEYSPLMFFDLDGTPKDMVPFVLDDCKKDPFIFTAFPSPSGEGLRIGIWTNAIRESHLHYYKAICQHLSESLRLAKSPIDISESRPGYIDSTTSDVSRIWFFTHVRPGYFYLNTESETFHLDDPPPKQAPPVNRPPAQERRYREEFTHLEKVETLIAGLESGQIDITKGIDNWFRIGCALASEFGEEGREMFHRACQFHQAYNQAACNQEYNRCLNKYTKGRITIATFYEACKAAGVMVDLDAIKKARAMGSKKGEKENIGGVIAPTTKEKEQPGKELEEPTGEQPKIVKMRYFLAKQYDFRLNIVSNDIEASQKGKNEFSTLNENNLLVELMEAGFLGVEAPLMALLKSDFVPRLDPFIFYFDSLPRWSPGDPDYIEHLAGFIEARDQQWFNNQFKKMLVRTVACAVGSLPFNKHCFTLKSNQNDGKSYFLRFLVPHTLKAYTTDHFDPNNKDGLFALCQNFIINLDELSTFSKADVRRIKAIFTLEAVKERLPYDRRPSNHKRRTSFLASTNDDEFLTDETGNVRWLVFEIHGVKHDNGGSQGYEAQVDIDLVWSQAYALMKQGFQYQLTKEEIQESEKNNRGYQITTLEMEFIQDAFRPGKKDDSEGVFMTAGDIADIIGPKMKGNISVVNIGRAMKILGFEKSQKHDFKSGYQRKGYWVVRINDNPIEKDPF